MAIVTEYDWESDEMVHYPASHTNGTAAPATSSASGYDADLDNLYAWMPPQAVPQPCPEACFSATVKGLLDGHETLLTARGQTPAEFKANLEAIRGLLDPVQAPNAYQVYDRELDMLSSPPASPQGPGTQGPGWCAVHDVAMQCNVRDGHSWFSHRLPEGGWCKGRK